MAATGEPLRVGIVRAPAKSVFFVVVHPDGAPEGVTVDLGHAMGKASGRPVAFTVFDNSGQATDAVAEAAVDVAFMPVDDARKARIAFGPAYTLIESTYLVTEASGMTDLASIDRTGARVIGIANTTTIRASGRSLKHCQPEAVPSVEAAVELLKAGKADAFALSRDSLPPFLPLLPGSRIVDGGFQQTGIAIAVPPGRPNELSAATAFMTKAKTDGTVRHALDAAGFPDAAVAP